ncbi:ATP-binding cassette sub-family D member 2 [Cimex lectularius]|uniref:ABC Transporter n=1 Tax=Cimex lectularius TaxID=79782 RepID=A0A8I6RG34_CIMLE|nr:ATP-binding cassette sub-family D member 2 [Cimex lectularius]XP_014244638.1 ATP-binding cassette sub-family D member 2 [Cimex lectularius]
MPTVISKCLEDVSKISVHKRKFGSGVLTAILLVYSCKHGYPYIKHLLHSTPKKTVVVSNNNKNEPNANVSDEPSDKRDVPGFNREFLIELYKLIRLLIPRLWCKEVGLLSVHTLALITRTFMSIYVATMEGQMVKFIVQRDINNFALMLLKWLGVALPATFLNSLIRYLECKIALAFRSRLVNHAYHLYMKNQTYYRVSNLDSRIENADHLLTEDIKAFTASLAHLYSHLTKPLFDCALIGLALARSSRQMGAAVIPGPLLAVIVISLTGQVLRCLSPKFGALVAIEAERSAYLRSVHSRLITNAEEIAFYGGSKVELNHLKAAYRCLVDHKNKILCQRLWYVVLEQFLMKYVWSGTGMIMVSIPILMASNDTGIARNVSDRTQYFTTARNLLISGADAVERLLSSYKEIVELAGYTSRVGAVLKVFKDVSEGVYQRSAITTSFNKYRDIRGSIRHSTDGSIKLCDVPIVTPTGDVVIPNLSIHIKPGRHLLITGPNGCGKSSMFRVICGLWPLYDGTLYIPPNSNMFYIPQRPYMSIGSLREQIIYPDTVEDMRKKGISDKDLEECLSHVALNSLVTREGGWSAEADWKDILSGGEKQRIAIARLFYHKPSFALLDECTSAVSMDVESKMYEDAKSLGITLLTITHRPSLWKFHDEILEFDGQGSWLLKEVSH